VSNADHNPYEQRPPIVITAMDCQRLSALLETAMEKDYAAAHFLREEIERADVARCQPAATSLVTMGSEVKFIDHHSVRVRELRLVYPEEADADRCISVLTPVGSALIGLGPGQSISWLEHGTDRRLTVLEVRPSPHEHMRTQRESIMTTVFQVGDHVTWNSEAGRVTGTIVKVHVNNLNFKGYVHHASNENPQYEIMSDKTSHIALHKPSALKLLRR
jgi:transcription elongation GreA/GreB family factor